jgi:ABC-type branched-subunit amino acid transport system substrate-binding protein
MDYVYSVKQAHDLGVKEKMKIYVPDASAYSSEKAIGPKAMEGVYLGTAFYWEAAMSYASGKKFVDDYQKEFGRKPSMQTYVAYAGALAWADAARIAKTLDGDAINNVWGSPGFSFDHGKGKVRWRVPDHTAIEDWYICRGRGPQAVAADPERILEVLKTTRGSEEYLYSLEELGYK